MIIRAGAIVVMLLGVGFATPALGQVVPVPQPPPTIGVAELEAAKARLAQAKGALQPEQLQRLEKGLVEAEGAFQRYAKLAQAGGRAAQVARGAQALTAAQRVSQIAEGAGEPLKDGGAGAGGAGAAVSVQHRDPGAGLSELDEGQG